MLADNLERVVLPTRQLQLRGLEFGTTGRPLAASSRPAGARAACFHCGEPCPDASLSRESRMFCCPGCLLVHELLAENGLGQFYELSRHPGVRIRQPARREEWVYLDAPAVQERLLDFTDGKISRVTFQVPAIHCVACVWLLENLFRLHAGIGQSTVDFARRELSLSFSAQKLPLSELVTLLASLGYEPRLTLDELDKPPPDPARKRRWLQLGIAGFAFGNIMLFSLPGYLGLDRLSGPLFKGVFGWLSLALAAPVVVYSASDYWRAAWGALRRRALTLDIPIALGLGALYAQSAFELLSGRGAGYLDSLAGLVFFLLCGRAFQQKTYDRMAFDHDYRCFFPLSVRRKTAVGEETVALSGLRVGDRLILRNGELIPADGRLLSGAALIDYSFVTGEAEPAPKQAGDYLYSGGRQLGPSVELETVKPVSQSYLTSLWNHEAFQKDREANLNTLTNHYSRRFTRIVLVIAFGAAAFWLLWGDTARALKAFTSVLIVACPCALALAAPFALGTAQRLLARLQVFLRNGLVLERLAKVDSIVFDKTGTLTAAGVNEVSFLGAPATPPASCQAYELAGGDAGAPKNLSPAEKTWVASLVRHSTHPHAVRLETFLGAEDSPKPVHDFAEIPGCGLEGIVRGRELKLGSRAWLENQGLAVPELALPQGSSVYLAIDGSIRGVFVLANALRPDIGRLLLELSGSHELALLSGDHEKERERFRNLFGSGARLRFNQSPLDKLNFIRRLQQAGKSVMMVGDGLNDAGALRQSDVGLAVVENVGAFSPASDVILAASQVPRLSEILTFARRATRIVHLSFGISALYNLAGISIAAAGLLSPVICAVLMPLSSVSVVLFACGATRWSASRLGLTK